MLPGAMPRIPSARSARELGAVSYSRESAAPVQPTRGQLMGNTKEKSAEQRRRRSKQSEEREMLDIGGFWQGALVIVPNEHCQLLRLCSERRYSDRGEGGTGGEEIVRLCRAASGQREAASEDDSVHNTPPIIQQPGTVANENRRFLGSSRKGRGLSRSRDTHVFDNRRTERGGHLGRFTALFVEQQ